MHLHRLLRLECVVGDEEALHHGMAAPADHNINTMSGVVPAMPWRGTFLRDFISLCLD